jgi:5-methylcytosine-specific restriction endonuclease McrA
MMTKLSDQSLLTGVLSLVLVERKATLQVLEYLSEIDLRKLWLREGYSSLHDFCVRYLNYSESEAGRRIQAARVMNQVQEVKPLLENNELSLTGLSTIAPHLTAENASVILPEVKRQSVRTIEKVIQHHFPDAKQKGTLLKLSMDEEFVELLEKTKLELSEKDVVVLFKRLMRRALREIKPRKSQVKKHTRYVQAEMKRQVKKENHYQCTYHGSRSSGVRCNQTAHVELEHILSYGKGGSSHDRNNLTLLCKSHNLMKAKQDFPHWHLSKEMKPNGWAASGYGVMQK